MDKIVLILIISCFTIHTSYGQKDLPVKPDSISTTVLAQPKLPAPPRPIGYTSDFEHILPGNEIDTLNLIIKHIETELKIQVAIVTIDSSYTTKDGFDNFITSLGNAWGVGDAIKNNGIVIGISASLRKTRISYGYGIEGKITDDETKQIIDNSMIPEFKEGKYYNGLKNGLIAITKKLR